MQKFYNVLQDTLEVNNSISFELIRVFGTICGTHPDLLVVEYESNVSGLKILELLVNRLLKILKDNEKESFEFVELGIVALAEACFGADSGCSVDISEIFSDNNGLDKWGALFGESLGRILVSVKAEHSAKFEAAMSSNACFRLGEVGRGDEITISKSGETILQASMLSLKQSWQATLDGGGA